jgi:hypothetical protein
VQNAKSQLESKVEEIQIRLSVETRIRQNAEKEKEELVKALEQSKEMHAHELVEAKKKYPSFLSSYPTDSLSPFLVPSQTPPPQFRVMCSRDKGPCTTMVVDGPCMDVTLHSTRCG